MKQTIQAFAKHQDVVKSYLKNIMINKFATQPDQANMTAIFKQERAIQCIYILDKQYNQITPTYYRKSINDEGQGLNKSRYLEQVHLKNSEVYISNAYISHKNGRPTLTAAKKIDDKYIILDFDLLILLEELHLIDYNSLFDKYNKIVIGTGAGLLAMVSIFMILYGGFIFIKLLVIHATEDTILHGVFLSIVSITIGLAIYDLSKNMIENDILYKPLKHKQSDILIKFLISIIIALSIESLMEVFKIVLKNYTNSIYALYLVGSVTMLIIGTALYGFLERKNPSDTE